MAPTFSSQVEKLASGKEINKMDETVDKTLDWLACFLVLRF
jgi:hypothetical protein